VVGCFGGGIGVLRYHIDLASLHQGAAEADSPYPAFWPHDLSDEEILERLLALNLERAGGV